MKSKDTTIPITVLTDVLAERQRRYWYLKMRGIVFSITKLSRFKPEYGGHSAVTRSLVEGLKKIGADFNYNPASLKDIKENVVVLSGVETLREAIELKRAGKIKKLLAGPNVTVFSSDENGIMADENIDLVIAPSEWSKVAYEEQNPKLIGHIALWPAGVDEEYWKPFENIIRDTILIYVKMDDNNKLSSEVIDIVDKQYGDKYKIKKIIYGKYTPEEFKFVLNKSVFAIFLSRSESQGLALAEAWSMNVPTLCYDPGENEYKGWKYTNAESAPYLTDQTGVIWKNLNDFEKCLVALPDIIEKQKPRNWILKNMSDKISSQNLVDYIINIKK